MSGPASPYGSEPLGFEDFDVRLGDVMRGERATLGKSLLDVQRDLKIKAAYIAAIENSDPGAFETPGFVAGYVRSYARYLGMDPDWAFRTFCAEADFSPTHGAASAVTPRLAETGGAQPVEGDSLFTRPRTPFLPSARPRFSGIEPGAIGSVAVLVALIGAIGYGGVAVFREVQKVQFAPAVDAPEIAAQIDPLASAFDIAEARDEAEGGERPSQAALEELYRPRSDDVLPAITPRDGPIASLDPSMVGAFSRMPDLHSAAGTGPELTSAAEEAAELLRTSIDSAVGEALRESGPDPAAGPELAAAPAEEADAEVTIFAVQPSWIRVRAGDGTVLFEKILDAHEEYLIPEGEGTPTLRAGNAGSVYFSVGGQTYGPAGNGPSVVKDVALTDGALRDNYALADPEEDGDLAEYYAVADARQEGARSE